MAKTKKGRFKRNGKARRRIISSYDRHHLCWTRRKWSRAGAVSNLRLHPYCIVLIPRDTLHRYIHSEMCYIPVPSDRGAKCALEQLEMLANAGAIHPDDPIEKRLKLLAALFDCVDQPTADGFREQLRIICEYKALYG